jgi:hypothetical protein
VKLLYEIYIYYKVIGKAMNSKTLFVAIAIVAAFGAAAAVVGPTTIAPVLAQDNMTMGGNMTGGNMTAGNMTGMGGTPTG